MDPFQTKFHICWGQQISDREKSKLFLKCKSPHLAILIHIWHIWEDRSRKVNNDEPILRIFTETFDLLKAMPFENLFREGVYRFHPYFWKPLTCGYVAAGAFFSPQKRAPYFWKPLTCAYVAASAFSRKKKRIFLEVLKESSRNP